MDGDRSYIHKTTGQKTWIKYEDGQYVMNMWFLAREQEVQEESEKMFKGNRFVIMATECEEGFTGACESRKAA